MNTFTRNVRAPLLRSRLFCVFCIIAGIQVLMILYQPDAEDSNRASTTQILRIAPTPILVNVPTIMNGIQLNGSNFLNLHSIETNVEKPKGSILESKAAGETKIACTESMIKQKTTIKTTGTRVACIIPYTGKSLPSWFDSFAFSAYSSTSLFDFLIFVTEIPQRELPPNVKIIRIEKNDLYERIAKLDSDEDSADFYENTVNSVKLLIENHPYALVEFKPCLGIIFADYLKEYSHWALADLDLLIGNMHKIITLEILNQYDIYTSSFGDSTRMYLRGQLTIHKNNPNINNLWRDCDHLSHLSSRLKIFSANHQWRFESAEGCYSSVAGMLLGEKEGERGRRRKDERKSNYSV